MFGRFKRKTLLEKIQEGMTTRGWKKVKGKFFPPSEHQMSTYVLGIEENKIGKIIVHLPKEGSFSDRCVIAALTDLVKSCGVAFERYDPLDEPLHDH